LVFEDIYGMNSGQEGLTFLGILVGALVATPPLFWHFRYYLEPRFDAKGKIEPEERLVAAMVGAFFIPACLFIFGWTARPDIHWIVPIFGSSLFGVAILLLYVCAGTSREQTASRAS
jgi:DHA1 family multidrug resistance protein-like MFS transporter